MQSNFRKGVSFALSAAALNATIGVLSKVLMSNGFTSSSVAVIKTILGCILLSIVLLFLKRPTSAAKWRQAAICAFLGIFVLFHFETSAYRHYAAAGGRVLRTLVFNHLVVGSTPGRPSIWKIWKAHENADFQIFFCLKGSGRA